MITVGATYGDSYCGGGTVIGIDEVKNSVGTKLTLSDNGVIIGSGVSKVLVSSSVFYDYRSDGPGYGWYNLQKNGNDTGYVAIGYTGTNYDTASITPILLDVSQGDKITLRNNSDGQVRGTATWLTVIAVG